MHVARAEKGELAYAGRIEHGLDATAVAQLEVILRPMVIERTHKKDGGYAVKPGVLIEISHRGITAGGVMRHPRFVRVRNDLAPAKGKWR